jgi:hypothetical protein
MPYKNIFDLIEYQKRYRARNLQKLKNIGRQHYLKNRKDYILRSKRHKLANPRKTKELARLYYQRKQDAIKKRMREYYQKNSERIKARVRLRAVKKPHLKKESDRRSYQKHRLKRLEQQRLYWSENRPRLLARQKLWREKNPDKIKASFAAYIKTHPEAKVCMNLRIRLNKILGNKTPRNLSVFNLVGCSLSTLRRHIENQFSGDMSWTNRGKVWHVDHIIPISLYENKNDANHYSNLRPMLAKINISRGNRIKGHFVFRGKKLVEHTA